MLQNMAPSMFCCVMGLVLIGRGGDPLRAPKGIAGMAGLEPASTWDFVCRLLPSLEVFLSFPRDGLLDSVSVEFVYVDSVYGV
jgi:hypothetical protein